MLFFEGLCLPRLGFDAPRFAAAFDEEGAISSHAGEDLLVGVHLADVPQAREQNAAIGRRRTQGNLS